MFSYRVKVLRTSGESTTKVYALSIVVPASASPLKKENISKTGPELAVTTPVLAVALAPRRPADSISAFGRFTVGSIFRWP